MTDLAVIIVTWNTRSLTLEALRSLFIDLDSSGLDAAVYVVDSASSDGTAEAIAQAFPQVKLMISPTNLGFAGSNNRALREIGFGTANPDLPKAVYLLNSDTITQLGATKRLYETLMADPKIGLVGARLSYADGSFQPSAFSFPGLRQLWVEFFPTPGRFIEGSFNGRYPYAFYEKGKPFNVDCVLGATMMLRREVIEQTGMFDEQFFMYCEEIDWAWRIRDAGWLVQCVPSSRVVHLAGQSTSQIRAQSVINLWTSRLRLFAKHYPIWKLKIALWMIAIGIRLKLRQLDNIPEVSSLRAAYQKIHDMALGLT